MQSARSGDQLNIDARKAAGWASVHVLRARLVAAGSLNTAFSWPGALQVAQKGARRGRGVIVSPGALPHILCLNNIQAAH